MNPCQLSQPITEASLLKQTITRLKQGWTKGAYALNAQDEQTLTCDTTAVSWCLHGAITRAFYDLTGCHPTDVSQDSLLVPLRKLRQAVDAAAGHISDNRAAGEGFNDRDARNVHEVIALLEYAGRHLIPQGN